MFARAPMLAFRGAGGAGAATTWDPTFKGANVTLSSDLLTATGPSTRVDSLTRGTSSRSAAKRFYEGKLIGGAVSILGLCNASSLTTDYPGSNANSVGYFPGGGNVFIGGNSAATLATCSANDVVGVAVDLTAGKVWFLKNGVSLSGDPVAGTGGFSIPSGALYPAIDAAVSTTSTRANFGASAFAFAPPSGFTAWG